MGYERVYAEIDLSAVRWNLKLMQERIRPDAKIVAVVKSDAYGHGALKIAESIEELPYLWGYAVATVNEALGLIEDGRKKPVLILGISFEEEYETIVEKEIRPCVCNYEMAQKLSEIACRQNKVCHIHVKLDTGMGRIGFWVNEESANQIARIKELANIDIEGIFTHFAKADELDKTPTYLQIQRFQKMIELLQQRNVNIPIHHCSNSAGIVEINDANMDLVRAGIILYGLWPSDEVDKTGFPLRPVMSLKSHVAFLKTLPEGYEVSYGGTYVTKKPTVIATIPVGYGDGYARSLSGKGYVLIRGRRAPICGRICMDQFMVDVTDIPGVKEKDVVTLLGRDGEETITMEELGNLSGRFNYEFACLITPRVPRIFHS